MSDTRTHLKAVGTERKEGAAADADAGAAARRPQPDAPSSRLPTWLIVALLALAGLALVIQTRRVGALSGVKYIFGLTTTISPDQRQLLCSS